jgi:hypothetical protein
LKIGEQPKNRVAACNRVAAQEGLQQPLLEIERRGGIEAKEREPVSFRIL